MDLQETLAGLRAWRDQLARIILQLEELQASETLTPVPKRRGRMFMSAEERAEVSKRMKLYWARRAKGTKERVAS